MGTLQARLDQHTYRESTVVCAQGFGGGQAGEFQFFVGTVDWLGVITCLRLCGSAGRLAFDAVERRQINRPGVNTSGRLIAVGGITGGIGVFVDLGHHGKIEGQQ
ncbi:hypothetical protein D3C85_1536310 [compost metagenome]